MWNSNRRLMVLGSFLVTANATLAQTTTTVLFDGTGAEVGITPPGTTDFSFLGSNWSGGVVATELIPPLYASGSFSYEIGVAGGVVTFDDPMGSVDFFFVHGFGFSAGIATAFDGAGAAIGSVNSNAATLFADPNNFVTLNPSEPIARIEFSGGVIDNFSYSTPPAPTVPAVSAWGAVLMSLLLVSAASVIFRMRWSRHGGVRQPLTGRPNGHAG